MQRLTEMVGEIVLRPYVPHGTKKIGNRSYTTAISYSREPNTIRCQVVPWDLQSARLSQSL